MVRTVIFDKLTLMHHFFFLLLVLPGVALAQNSDWTGNWVGELTQKSGGYGTIYQFELYIYETEERVKGISVVDIDDLHAEMAFEGRIIKGVLYIKESRIITATQKEGLYWCLKTAQLRLIRSGSKWGLTGPWQGISELGSCIPGDIRLYKQAPQA